jgi:sulfite exporter TauE/SafE
MNLDLRIPMGLMFTLVGAILTAFGAATNGNAELYAPSLGINANLWWGIVLLAFGLTMFFLGRAGQKKLASLPQEPIEEGTVRRGH